MKAANKTEFSSRSITQTHSPNNRAQTNQTIQGAHSAQLEFIRTKSTDIIPNYILRVAIASKRRAICREFSVAEREQAFQFSLISRVYRARAAISSFSRFFFRVTKF